ncbi:MAG: hypothetical protein JXA30_17460 [Deltaproteobacteria bacterium]|nr:hypothetical protein [Deltaproteobacteria bacterium]
MKIKSTIVVAAILVGLISRCSKDDDIMNFESSTVKCRDLEDNDGDGYTDCEDQDCLETSACNDDRDSASNRTPKDSGVDAASKVAKTSDSGRDAEVDANPSDDGSMQVCDEQGFVIDPKPVTVMFLLDYSSSMSTVSPEIPVQRWPQAISALTTLLGSISNPYISFGLDLFPDGSDTRVADGKSGECGVGNPVQIDCADGNERVIIDYLANTPAPPTTGNMTPMWCGVNNFSNPAYAPGCNAEGVEPYVVVISDGSDTCGLDCHCMDTPDTCGEPEYGATASELASLTQQLCANSVKTFVISFGGGADYGKLNAMAKNGCTVMTSFLDAADGDALLAAFDRIIDAVVPCEYEIDKPDETIADPNQVNFYFDDKVIPNIPEIGSDCKDDDGWQWMNKDHTKMHFCNEACNQLKNGTVSQIKAKFGCPTVLI